MSVPALVRTPADSDRRRLLSSSDELLDEVEQLRLDDEPSLPDPLRQSIAALQARIGRPGAPPRTVKAAHDLVFAIQQRLMAANPHNPTTRSHPGRGSGQFVTAKLPGDASWKLLALPPLPTAGVDAGWMELVQETVQRAADRWEYAQHQAVKAARAGSGTRTALARAAAAWDNYWELREEAHDLTLRRLRGAPSS